MVVARGVITFRCYAPPVGAGLQTPLNTIGEMAGLGVAGAGRGTAATKASRCCALGRVCWLERRGPAASHPALPSSASCGCSSAGLTVRGMYTMQCKPKVAFKWSGPK